MTNYEKIKAMTVEELAIGLTDVRTCQGDTSCCGGCMLETCRRYCDDPESVQDWLLREAEEAIGGGRA